MAESTALLKRRGGQTPPRVRIPPSPIQDKDLRQVGMVGSDDQKEAAVGSAVGKEGLFTISGRQIEKRWFTAAAFSLAVKQIPLKTGSGCASPRSFREEYGCPRIAHGSRTGGTPGTPLRRLSHQRWPHTQTSDAPFPAIINAWAFRGSFSRYADNSSVSFIRISSSLWFQHVPSLAKA